MKQLLTIKDLARLLQMSVRQVYREKAANRLPKAVRVGVRGVRYDPDDIQKLIDDSKNAKGRR